LCDGDIALRDFGRVSDVGVGVAHAPPFTPLVTSLIPSIKKSPSAGLTQFPLGQWRIDKVTSQQAVSGFSESMLMPVKACVELYR
jgi:hypothetical protein